MILAIETTALCIVFFLLCFLGTGTDEKNLKNYSSYPDEDQNLINEIAKYRGRYKDSRKAKVFLLNFLLFLFLFFILGLFIRDSSFLQYFVSLTWRPEASGRKCGSCFLYVSAEKSMSDHK